MPFRNRGFRLLGALLLLSAPLAWPQGGTSTIRGEVTDPQGAAVPAASVTITNLATNLARRMVSNASGRFSFELIPPGEYRLDVEKQGFKKQTLSPVHAFINAPTGMNVKLELGSVSEVVRIEAAAGAVAVNTQDASLGNNFVSYQITQLPLEARNVTALLTLQPGVTREGYVAGARSDQSNVTLDGIDINDAQTNSIENTVLRLNSEAIEEFRVTTQNANANQGHSSAAQVNLATKSGTNSLHGSLFEFIRDTSFTANDFFNNRTIDPFTDQTIPRPELRRNTYGGAIGGPLTRDRLFFFFSYEGTTESSEQTIVRRVPLAVLGTGSLRYKGEDGNAYTLTRAQLDEAFPAVRTNPLAIAALADAAKKYPANDFTVGDSQADQPMNTAGYRFNASTPADLNSNTAKIDCNINRRMAAFVRASVILDATTRPSQFPDTPRPTTWSHPSGLATSHTWIIGAKAVNNFRYGFTRGAVSSFGDSGQNTIIFGAVFQPYSYSWTVNRKTPVHNFVDDVSWEKGNHTLQFGANVRFVRNSRLSFSHAYDVAATNASMYAGAGSVVSRAISNYLAGQGLPSLVSVSGARNAATALIGRYSAYAASFTFDLDGDLLPPGTPTDRTFATEECEWYFQDAMKVARNLTLTYGLRYGLSRPVYETHGYEVAPTVPMSEYFRRRIAGMESGVPYNESIVLARSGPASSARPMYDWDKNNLQPRIAFSWAPGFERGLLRTLLGKDDQSVFRGGFAVTHDNFGHALAVIFDLNNSLGFSSNSAISANTYNVTTRPAPLFTGYDQAIRFLPGIDVPQTMRLTAPANRERRIEMGLDGELHAPVNYTWNFTFERQFPAGVVLQASYLGRAARGLLAMRDPVTPNNLRDPRSGQDFFSAATALEKLRQAGYSGTVVNQPFFENTFPDLQKVMAEYYGAGTIPAGLSPTQVVYYLVHDLGFGNDWTTVQDQIDHAYGKSYFFQPQYGALATWSTIARSNYHALTLSARQRFRNSLQWDFNYTWSHSLDDASGTQWTGPYASSAFILSPLRQRESYTHSDFDVRHLVNINGIYGLPFGRGRAIGMSVPGWADALVGGWQLSGIFRWNTGRPAVGFYDDGRWATNWQNRSYVTPTRPISSCVTKGDANNAPKLFGCDPTGIYRSFRNAYPGETGARNAFRLPGYVAADAGLYKSFRMPWKEDHRLQLRWEVFNLTNTQHFGPQAGVSVGLDPALNNLMPPANWSNFTGIQGSPRVMQFGVRFTF